MGGNRGPQAIEAARRFGRGVVERRRQVGLTQEGVAERAGLHRTHVAMIEHGERLPRLDTIVKLGGALEIEPCALLDGLIWKLEEPKEGSR